MNKRTFIIGFLIFDILAVLIIILLFAVIQPFKPSVAPDTNPTTTGAQAGTPAGGTRLGDIDTASMKLMTDMPGMVGMHEEYAMTADGKYYTAFKASLDLDMDGDGIAEAVSISLDEPSCSFYVLVVKENVAYEYILPGEQFAYSDIYGAKVCKGALRGFTLDLDSSDNYVEVGVELMRDSWVDYDTIVVRFDGSKVQASQVHGFISGVDQAGKVQFATYDEIYGEHKLYRTYKMTSDADFLVPETVYFPDINVEKTSFVFTLPFDLNCKTLDGQDSVIAGGTQIYWLETDNETYVDVVTNEDIVYRLPIRAEVMQYETGEQTVFYLGDKYAADLHA